MDTKYTDGLIENGRKKKVGKREFKAFEHSPKDLNGSRDHHCTEIYLPKRYNKTRFDVF